MGAVDTSGKGTVLSFDVEKQARVCRSYILFESRFARGLHCAVPKSHPIPDFLIGPSWRCVGTLSHVRKALLGFSEKAAQGAVDLDGYYFFFPRARRP